MTHGTTHTVLTRFLLPVPIKVCLKRLV